MKVEADMVSTHPRAAFDRDRSSRPELVEVAAPSSCGGRSARTRCAFLPVGTVPFSVACLSDLESVVQECH
jgi:hypothetical protein